MTDFQVGELVDIHIKGATVKEQVAPGALEFDLYGWPMRIRPGLEGVTVTRVGPANWPPAHGDIWSDHEGYHWVIMLRRGELVASLVDDEQGSAFDIIPAELLEKYQPLVLQYRRAPGSVA